MSVSDPSAGPRHVAVGPTREAAAAQFGVSHTDLFLTSYEELTAEVDLDRVDSLDLAAGEGLYSALDQVCRELDQASGFTLRVEYTPGTREALTAALERNNVAIADVQGRPGGLLIVLEIASPGSDPRTHLVLSGIDAADAAAALSADAGAAPEAGHGSLPVSDGTADPAVPTHPSPRAKRPQPRLLRLHRTLNQWRNNRRRRAAVSAGLVALALALLAVGMVSRSVAPVIVVLLVLLILSLLAATGLLLMTMLALSRQVHAQTGRIERMLLRNRAVVQRRTGAVEQRLSGLLEQQKRLPFMQDYLEAMAAASSLSAVRIADQIESLSESSTEQHLDTQRQVQAALNLHQLVEIPGRVPPMGGWAASADFNVLMLEELIRIRPRTVVECGSGTTTLLLALAVRQYGLSTRVVALEHLESFKAQTEETLRLHGVADFAEVRLAPLGRSSVPDHATPWYAEEALTDLHEIGLLIVDGPPATTGDRARFPAVLLLLDRMSARCSVVVDDLNRPTDLEVVRSWSALLPDFELEQLDTLQKSAGVLRRGGSARSVD